MGSAVYWRRRAVLIALLGLVVVGVAQAAGRGFAAVDGWRTGADSGTGSPTTPEPTGAATSAAADELYVVQAGDTLWSIAQRLRPGSDPRPTVDELARRAGTSALRPGQRLSLRGL